MTRALHHVALGTQRVEELAAFYREAVGLSEVRRNLHDDGSLRSVWLDIGGSVLMIESTTEPARHVSGIGAGPFLLAFAITSEERAAIENRLESHAARVESRTEFTFYTRDPDGNRIAFSHYPLA